MSNRDTESSIANGVLNTGAETQLRCVRQKLCGGQRARTALTSRMTHTLQMIQKVDRQATREAAEGHNVRPQLGNSHAATPQAPVVRRHALPGVDRPPEGQHRLHGGHHGFGTAFLGSSSLPQPVGASILNGAKA